MRSKHDERVGPEREDVVPAGRGGGFDQVDHRAERGDHGVASPYRLVPDAAVVDHLDLGRERPAVRVFAQHSHGASDRRRSLALGAGGQVLGIALVQAHDGIAQVVERKDLAAPQPPLVVHLDEVEDRPLERSDVDVLEAEAARGDPEAPQSERVAERRERLDAEGRMLGRHDAAPR
jgi:hypothetical protein